MILPTVSATSSQSLLPCHVLIRRGQLFVSSNRDLDQAGLTLIRITLAKRSDRLGSFRKNFRIPRVLSHGFIEVRIETLSP